MKANRKFRMDDEAVSPVIGVILMVAITVVLAAVVFVLVSDLGGDSESAPNVVFQKDEAQDRITVTRADADAHWGRIALNTNISTTVSYNVNVEASAASGAANEVAADGSTEADGADIANDKSVDAGDYIDLCAASDLGKVKMSVIDTVANSVVAEFNFASITGDCS